MDGERLARPWLLAAGVFGALGVLAGAFGAHALRLWLPLQVMTIFETAVRYHLLHTLALLGCAVLLQLHPGRAGALRPAAWAFAGGIVLFSGSLYAYALTGLTAAAAVTPVGGVAWVVGWLLLAYAYRPRRGA